MVLALGIAGCDRASTSETAPTAPAAAVASASPSAPASAPASASPPRPVAAPAAASVVASPTPTPTPTPGTTPPTGPGAKVTVTAGPDPVSLDPIVASGVANGLSVRVHRYVDPPRSGKADDDYWTQFQAWGEITNESQETFESVSARIVFFDGSGKIIGTNSIASAAQEDAGDHAAGENVLGEVGFVAPGESIPFHYMRNLKAIEGEVASFEIYPRRGIVASDSPPKGVAVDVRDALEGEPGLQVRTLSGTIRNDGTGGCRDPYFVVAVLDPQGRIGAVESMMAQDDTRKVLANGESIAFSGRIHLYDDNAWKTSAKLRTWVDCKPTYD